MSQAEDYALAVAESVVADFPHLSIGEISDRVHGELNDAGYDASSDDLDRISDAAASLALGLS